MWWTSEGERVLKGSEAALFIEALGAVVDVVAYPGEEPWHFGIPPFDDLPRNQQLAVLEQVGSALLQESIPMPRLTAVLEATVAVIFHQIRDGVQMEIDEPEATEGVPSWRHLILQACRERGIEDDLLEADSDDMSEWELLVDCLEGGVLWDQDWADGHLYLDMPPEAGRSMKALMGVDSEYYTAIPPDPSDQEAEAILARLAAMTEAADGGPLLSGIEDLYHGLLVGPCTHGTADTEQSQCRLLESVEVVNLDAFDCSYEQWQALCRPDVMQAAQQPAGQVESSEGDERDAELADAVHRAQTAGLEDGTRIEPHEDGWAVVDRTGGYLVNPEDCTWVQGEGDDEVRPAVFATPKAAYKAWVLSREVSLARLRRRQEVLRRLGRNES